MQGKPPPNQAAKGPPSSPSGMAPQSPPGQAPPSPPGGLLGKAPPAGADAKRRGRGGARGPVSAGGGGKSFQIGWKTPSCFKIFALRDCPRRLVFRSVHLRGTHPLRAVDKAPHS